MPTALTGSPQHTRLDKDLSSGTCKPPYTGPLVTDSGVYTTGGACLYARWLSHDPESCVVRYEYCVGTAPDSCDMVGWTPIDNRTKGCLLVSGLVSGTEYFINIRAINAGNLISGIGSSNGITYLNPAEDPDVDGSINEVEVAEKSDPFNPYSVPGETRLTLKKGFNLASFPAEALYYENALNLLKAIGGSDVISEVFVFDPVSQTFNEIGFDEAGQFYGQNMAPPSGQGLVGLIVYAKQDATFTFTSRYCPTWNLKTGTNLVGTSCAASGLTAFQLLKKIGSETVVSSIQKYNSATGEFETAGHHNGQPVGVDFLIEPGEGYFVYMRQDVLGFRP